MILQILSILKRKRYKLYKQPYQLNIVGVRSSSTTPNSFDDRLYVLFKDEHLRWRFMVYKITTDPGTYWLKNPLNVDGTAILKEGQYENAYRLGLHRGQYKALVQVKPVITIRDYDRNASLDFFNGSEHRGYFGINIHRALPIGETKDVNKWSAGCQVFANAEDFSQFMQLCERHRSYYGNYFTYTLIDNRALVRQTRRWILYGFGASALIVAGFATYYILNDLKQT